MMAPRLTYTGLPPLGEMGTNCVEVDNESLS